MKKKIVISLIFIMFIFVSKSKADEFWAMTLVTCVPEIDYFSAEGIRIHSGSSQDSDFMLDNPELMRKKYNMIRERDNKIYECKLNNANIKMEVKYLGYMSNWAELKLWLNDNLVVDLNWFNQVPSGTGAEESTVEKIEYKYNGRYNEEDVLFKGNDIYTKNKYYKHYETFVNYKNSKYDKVITNEYLNKVMFKKKESK